METRLYRLILLKCVPFIRFTTYYTSLRGNKYHEGYRLLRPGCILLTVDRRKLTSVLIPGTMSHAALCVFKRPPHDALMGVDAYEVAEMTHENYTRSDFFDICKEADRVVILQCLDWDDDYVARVIDACLGFKDAKYDVEFELGVKSLYCSELVYEADKTADYWARGGDDATFDTDQKYGRLQVDLSDVAGLGRPYISPDGLLFAKNVRCVWDSDGFWQGLMGPQIEERICR